MSSPEGATPVSVRVAGISDLGPRDLELWTKWGGASPFFHPVFTQLVAESRDDVQIAIASRDGKPIAFFPHHRGRGGFAQSIGLRLTDYHGPIVEDKEAFDPLELLSQCGLKGWAFNHLPASLGGFESYAFARGDSPFMDLSSGFAAYRDQQRRKKSRLIPQIERKARKIEREIGPLRFVPRTVDRAVLKELFTWKSSQRARTHSFDVLKYSWVRELLAAAVETNRDGFEGRLSALYAGDRLVAAHLGLSSGEVMHYWFPAYDPGHERYSPGLILLLELARHAAEEGRYRIDLGKGSERYKRSLESGTTPLAAGLLARNPLRRAAWRAGFHARRALRGSVLRAPLDWIRQRGLQVSMRESFRSSRSEHSTPPALRGNVLGP